jgi:uncharacterized protein YjiS (DUF1127 family)
MPATIKNLARPLAVLDRPSLASRVAAALRRHRERRRQREELARMSDLELRDLGLAPADRIWIARASFWKSHPFAEDAGARRR